MTTIRSLVKASGIFAFLAMLPAAAASEFDRSGLRGDTYCFAAKFATSAIEAIDGLAGERRDIVDVQLNPRFRIYDGGDLPDRFYLKTAAGETDFTVFADGKVKGFVPALRSANSNSQICIDDPARSGRPNDDEGLYFEMGLTPYFKTAAGEHSLSELEEAGEDARVIYKSFIPKMARLFMPAVNHLSVKAVSSKQPLSVIAYDGERRIKALTLESYNEAFVFDCRALRKLGADRIKIEGGPYALTPVPSVSAMGRFGIGKPRGTVKSNK